MLERINIETNRRDNPEWENTGAQVASGQRHKTKKSKTKNQTQHNTES